MKVESGIPVPQTRRRYPFDELDVGDSFAVSPSAKDIEEQGLEQALRRLRSSLVSSASAYGKRHGKSLIVRRVEEDGESCLRCWRIGDDDLQDSAAEEE